MRPEKLAEPGRRPSTIGIEFPSRPWTFIDKCGGTPAPARQPPPGEPLDFLIQGVMFLAIGAVTCVPYLSSLGAVPRQLKFLAEMLSGLVALYVIVAGTRQHFHRV